MARTANATTRPAASILATAAIRGATIREIVEMANYALATSRATILDTRPNIDIDGTAAAITTLGQIPWSAANRDADAQAYVIQARWLSGAGAGMQVEVSDDGGATWTATTTLDNGTPLGAATLTPSASPDGQLRLRAVGQGPGTSTLRLSSVRIREADLAAADIPTHDEI